jgi:hypothetical protein
VPIIASLFYHATSKGKTRLKNKIKGKKPSNQSSLKNFIGKPLKILDFSQSNQQ